MVISSTYLIEFIPLKLTAPGNLIHLIYFCFAYSLDAYALHCRDMYYAEISRLKSIYRLKRGRNVADLLVIF